jgi:hypothetical protein
MSRQTEASPKVLLIFPTPDTVIGKQVGVAPLSGIAPPVPLNV